MKKIFTLTFLLALILIVASAHADWNPRDREEEESAVKYTVDRFLRADPSLRTFVDKAYGYAVMPTVGKGAFILGVGYGKGWLFENGKEIGRAIITQLSAGAQIGGQTYSEIIFFRDMESVEKFKKGQFELGAQVSAVAVTEGVGKASTYTDGVAVFILPKAGLMAEASVSGQRFDFEPF
jgi:lipid-binding SYLF domain-containing protein